ncbi:MAG: NAD-dependent epimerase/dehydratase family protein, partial [bacterium]
MGSILVTGGAGFIGSHLVGRLLRESRKVIAVDNFDDYYDPKIKRDNIKEYLDNRNFELREVDLRDPQSLRKVFQSYKIARVIHLAARPGVRPSLKNPLLYEEVNVKGTLNLLEVCKDYPPENFIFASSSSVYGTATTPFVENESLNKPTSFYAATKLSGELICHTYHHLYGIPTICLRLFTVYGPRQRPEMAIHKFTRLIDEGREITIFGNGHSK